MMSVLTAWKKFKTYSEFSENILKIIDALKEYKTFEGEEIFYPLAFQKSSSVLEYAELNKIPVFYSDYDRQKNSSEILLREYMGLYKKQKLSLTKTKNEKLLFRNIPNLNASYFNLKAMYKNIISLFILEP